MSDLINHAESILPTVVDLRRRIHRHPELGLALPVTQALVAEDLDAIGVPYRLGTALGSVVGVIEGSAAGPDVLLRADMDALPLAERTDLPFASEVDGAMHACGHDTHVAMLLGAARLIMERRDSIAGRVLLMFQPGEEGFGGAEIMISEGLLDGVDRATARAFALHITAAFPNGTVNTRPGSLMAAPDSFEIEVIGRGGHASEPYRTVDPIPVAAEIVMALQAMVTRRVNVFDPAVLTVASIHAGTTHNVIPDSAGIQGTIRTLSAEARAAMEANLRTVVAGVASAHGAVAEVVVKRGYPATNNDPRVAGLVGELATELFGPQALHILPAPRMGGEDFSYVLNEIPGAMAFLGGRPLDVDPATAPMNHSSRVVFDESVMAKGVALNTAFALRVLDAQAGTRSPAGIAGWPRPTQ